MMEYDAQNSQNPKKMVEDTHDLWKKYSQERETWARNAKEDKEFRLGRQWTKDQEETLTSRGQAPIVVNRIHPAVESAKAILTSNRPMFRCAAREDSDNKVAQVFSSLLSYMYDISDGRTVVRQIVDDYYVCGVGYMLIYQDPMKDMGKGEVCMHDIDPLDVYIDPNSRSRFLDDAENIIISRIFTVDQAKKLYPMYKEKIKNASSKWDKDWDAPITGRADSDQHVIFPEDVKEIQDQEYLRGYERYAKIHVQKMRIYEKFSRKEDLLDEREFAEYVQRPAWIIEGNVVTDERQAQAIIQQLQQQAMQKQAMQQQEMAQMGYGPDADPPPIEPPNVQQVTMQDLIQQQMIDVVQVTVPRIKQCIIMGDELLYERILPTDKYPIVPFMNMHTRTPFPVSDVRLVKGLQEYINKTRSLIIAHATTSTNTKILVPEGSVDMREFEEKWAQPGVAIPYDPTDGAPMPVQPSPLPNELYQNEQTAKTDIDHQLGLYEMMMGNTAAAPSTYKGTIAIDEFGQRKMKSKLADIEAGLTRAGQVAIDLMQQLYQAEKIFRVVNPNNSLNEYVINKRLVDDKTNEVQVMNDITVGKYDVIVVAGSTLPSNRYAELEFHMDAYGKGIIDKQEVLKKTEVYDMEGVLQRTDLIGQLQQALQATQEEVKKLKGDLQTRDRESINLRKKAEVEKFKGQLDQVGNKAKAAGTIFEKRLEDNLGQVKKEIADAIADSKEEKKSPSPSKAKKQGRRK
jgi:hypothetical protein